MKNLLLLPALLLLPLQVSLAGDAPRPPVATKKEKTLEIHGYKRPDPYFWMREKENPELLQHLRNENAYTDQMMSGTVKLREKLFQELKAGVKEVDVELPYLERGYFYYARTEKGKQYKIYARKKGSLSALEEILYDENELSRGHDYYNSTGPSMSPNQKLMAVGTDYTGGRLNTIQIKDLEKNEYLPVKIENTSGEILWANDNETVFYILPDLKTMRSDRVIRHNLKTGETVEIFNEADAKFDLSLADSLAGNFLFIDSSSKTTNEVLYLNANDPKGQWKVFSPREAGHKYEVQDAGDRFFVLTNWNAVNFRLMETSLQDTGREQWNDVIPHRESVFLEKAVAFSSHIVTEESQSGSKEIFVYDRKSPVAVKIPFAEKAFDASISIRNKTYETDRVLYAYESPKTPQTFFDFQFSSQKIGVVKQPELPVGYRPELYKVERVWITARDGAKVPVTLLMKKDHKPDGKSPLFTTGYGSYGYSSTPSFSHWVFSLVNRGFVVATLHVRGGSELGRPWYENGKLKKKMNTFYDYIDGTEELLKRGYGDRARVYANGGSAGGLLMGAIMNLRPDLYRAILAEVPFVDVLSTMLDDTIPLTTSEYEEWGNPNVKEDYEYMAKYSPYDNIHKAAYPYVLATGGLNDSQVPYWEPSKFVAKLRDFNQSKTFSLLRINLEAGHGGSSGRFDALKEVAYTTAFILMIDQPLAKQAK